MAGMKKWLVRSSTGNASARLVETSGGVRVRVPGKGSVFVEMSDTCAAELRCLPGVSVEEVTRGGKSDVAATIEILDAAHDAVQSALPDESEELPAEEPPKPKRKRLRKKK